jgi:hypothetical protein
METKRFIFKNTGFKFKGDKPTIAFDVHSNKDFDADSAVYFATVRGNATSNGFFSAQDALKLADAIYANWGNLQGAE